MPMYIPVTGTLTRISWPEGSRASMGCTMTLTLQTGDQGIVNFTLPSSAYVLNARQFAVGDRITCFYENNVAVPLIYPPLYRAVAAAHTPAGTTAVLDTFNNQLTNSDGTIRLNMSSKTTKTVLPNGQLFVGYLAGKTLLVLYTSSTRSIPAQTTPEQIVVFCQDMQDP